MNTTEDSAFKNTVQKRRVPDTRPACKCSNFAKARSQRLLRNTCYNQYLIIILFDLESTLIFLYRNTLQAPSSLPHLRGRVDQISRVEEGEGRVLRVLLQERVGGWPRIDPE